MKKVVLTILLVCCAILAFSQNACPDTVLDIDGNTYSTVIIGTQCWMAQNLRASHDRYGKLIPLGNGLSYTSPYSYLNTSGIKEYGNLYNWAAAMRVCPVGWHLPSDAEWGKMLEYVGEQLQYRCEGDKDKIAKSLADSLGWKYSPWDSCSVGKNPSTNNATGFSAQPADCYDGYYYKENSYAFFWSSTASDAKYAYYRYFRSDNGGVDRHSFHKSYGYSVRCLRDK